jgi:hypothetical protein
VWCCYQFVQNISYAVCEGIFPWFYFWIASTFVAYYKCILWLLPHHCSAQCYLTVEYCIVLTARGICLLAQVEWWCKPTFWVFIFVCIVPYIYQLQILLFGNYSGSNLVLIHIQHLQYSEILAVPFYTTYGDQVEEKERWLALPFLLQFEERFDLCSYVRYAASVQTSNICGGVNSIPV